MRTESTAQELSIYLSVFDRITHILVADRHIRSLFGSHRVAQNSSFCVLGGWPQGTYFLVQVTVQLGLF